MQNLSRYPSKNAQANESPVIDSATQEKVTAQTERTMQGQQMTLKRNPAGAAKLPRGSDSVFDFSDEEYSDYEVINKYQPKKKKTKQVTVSLPKDIEIDIPEVSCEPVKQALCAPKR